MTADLLQGFLLGGESETLASVARQVELAASVEAPVLITGETGTGKNVVAGAIHYKSRQKKDCFISINCAALPENLIESELFGYERGAFTGAVNNKRGIFELAEGGTLFLDEIGDMPYHLQTKLLGVIEEKRIRRLGGIAFLPVNVRIIAATQARLDETLGRSFREDLYFRLSVIHIHLLPLRERRHDIPLLCRFLLDRICKDRRCSLDDVEMERLLTQDWPGNIRELRNVLERATLMQSGDEIRPSEVLERPDSPPVEAAKSANESSVRTLKDMEKNHIVSALQACSFNLSRTSRALGISRSTLKRKIQRYGLK